MAERTPLLSDAPRDSVSYTTSDNNNNDHHHTISVTHDNDSHGNGSVGAPPVVMTVGDDANGYQESRSSSNSLDVEHASALGIALPPPPMPPQSASPQPSSSSSSSAASSSDSKEIKVPLSQARLAAIGDRKGGAGIWFSSKTPQIGRLPSGRQLRILMPLPDHDFDTTEAAVPWRMLKNAGFEIVFATERGAAGPPPQCDPLLITGVICGCLGADAEAIRMYRAMEQDASFKAPISWHSIVPSDYDGLLLSGGHAQGMRQYLASKVLQERVSSFWELNRPVGAICHGPLVLARARDRHGQSLLADRSSMCLPKYMERRAYLVTCCFRGSYYRTYPAYVEDEVKGVMRDPARQYDRGPQPCCGAPPKGTIKDDSNACVTIDRNYVSARWPGDVYLYAKTFIQLMATSYSK